MTSPAEAAPGRRRRRALVVGTGLIGGSIAPRAAPAGWHVSGLDADPARAGGGSGLGVIDAVGDDPGADVVFVAVPAAAVAGGGRAVLGHDGRRPDAVVTDVSGVKTTIVGAS